MVRFDTEWRARWQGHSLIVRNWWNLFLVTGEELYVDGKLRDKRSGIFRVTSTLTAACRDDEERFVVRAYLWPDATRVLCHVYVNDELIGGDLDAEPWRKH
jgi:hypothetical protein